MTTTAAPAAALSYRQVLRNPRVAVLLGGDAVSKVGDGMLTVALPLQALAIHDSVGAAFAVSAAATAPFLISVPLSLLFGLTRRRFPPWRTLLVDSVLRTLLFGGLGLAALAGHLKLAVMVVAIVLGSALRLLALAARRIVAVELTGPAGVFAVNGLSGLSLSLATFMLGPALGGVICAVWSPAVALVADGVTFLAMIAGTLVAMPRRSTRDSSTVLPPQRSGARVLRAAPRAYRLVVFFFAVNLIYMPIEVALPLMTNGPLHSGAAGLGIIWTTFGVGALIGAAGTTLLRRFPQRQVLVAIVAGWGAAMVVMPAAPNVPFAAVVFGIGGVIWAPFTPIAYTLAQQAVDQEDQQPVVTLLGAGSSLALPLGLALGGPAVTLLGSRGTILASGLLTLALAVPALRAARRDPASADLGPAEAATSV